MISFPRTTAIHKRIPKEAFYKRLSLNTALKEKFVSDIDTIYMENSLTRDSLHLLEESSVKEIIVLGLELKKHDCDRRIMEAIARQNQHKLIFVLTYGERKQLALVFHGKLYQTEWMTEEALSLEARGFQMNEVWESLVEQVALPGEEHNSDLSLDERLARRERRVKLEKKIQKTEAAVWKEKQPKKRFALYQKLQKYKQELEDLNRGQTQNAHP